MEKNLDQITAYCHGELYILRNEVLGVKFGYTKNLAIYRAESIEKAVKFNAKSKLPPIFVYKIYKLLKFSTCDCYQKDTSVKRREKPCAFLEYIETAIIHSSLKSLKIFPKSDEATSIDKLLDKSDRYNKSIGLNDWYDLNGKSVVDFEDVIEDLLDKKRIKYSAYFPEDFGYKNNDYCIKGYKEEMSTYPIFPDCTDDKKYNQKSKLHK